MKKIVHIKVSDQGWILEKLAREITTRLPYVSYNLTADASADIQYYMTYGCRNERISPVEIALFTHKEEVQSAAEKFDSVAADVDFCVAQSLKTEEILTEIGIKNVITISPGVDLERYSADVRIGVVGRTYHTGRKGENLVAQVMDIPGIQWHFTGEGWPGPAQHIPEESLPEFYRSLDYILVPALIEGGPMCVLEALASGCQVIASPVGWVPQFPHIEFNLGDVNDLRRVLLEVVEKKQALRRSVENYTWQSWADQHHILFCQLLGYDPLVKFNFIKLDSQDEQMPSRINALVAVHGQEMTKSLGGPSVRAPKTVSALKKLGVNAQFASDRNFCAHNYDVIHALNVWHPTQCEILLQQIEKNDRPSVLSPIFLDLSELDFFNNRVKLILSMYDYIDDVKEALSTLRSEILAHRNKPMIEREPMPGYFSKVRRLTSFASHLILLSELERDLLKQIGVAHSSTSIVKNPVDTTVFNSANPQLFRDKIGLEQYVLCVGRIEPRKNQALLALSLKDTQLPLVFIGHEADSEYADLIRKWGGDNVYFAGRVDSNSAMLASAFAGAKVFCLASWSEGAPLVALEAAAAGCNMVLSNRSSEEEYFGNLARYVDPADIDDIRNKVISAWNDSETEKDERAQILRKKMQTEHSWENYAMQTYHAYKMAIKSREQLKSQELEFTKHKKNIYVDLTTVAHHKGPPTGITRVELCMAEALHKQYGDEIHYIVWNSHHRKFLCIDYSMVEDNSIKFLSEFERSEFKSGKSELECNFRKNDVLLVFGSAWIRNLNYIKSLKTLKLVFGVSIVTAIYDVIEYKLKFMFPEDRRNQFSRNCREIINISDKLITCSMQTQKDVVEFCLENNISLRPISIFRLGDEEINNISLAKDELISENSDNVVLPSEKFVLYVSTINIRKNHSQLLMLWRSLIKEYGNAVPKLVLVGSVGWGGEEAIHIIENNHDLQEKVLLLHDVDDMTLAWLYKQCMFTVYPSRYEGWGLPVAESCCYGKFCLASDAGSLPEVAPGCAEYIDPMDSIAWYNAISKYCFDEKQLAEKTEQAKKYVPTTWIETVNQVIDSIENVKSTERIASLAFGNTISFSAAPQPGTLRSDAYTLSGWSNNESMGTWTCGHESVFGFQLDEEAPDDLAINLSAFGYSPDGEAVKVSIFINSVRVAQWSIGGKVVELSFPIPRNAIDSSKNVIIRMKIDNAKSPYHFGSGDMRILGLYVQRVTLVALDSSMISSVPTLNQNDSTRSVKIDLPEPTLTRKIKNRLRYIASLVNRV